MLTPKQLTRNNIILLICLMMMICFFPALTTRKVFVIDIIFTGIILSGSFSLDFRKKTRRILIASGCLAICMIWLAFFFSNDILYLVVYFSVFCFFFFITVFLVRRVARSKEVTGTIIINAINGYLLIGIFGAVLLAMVDTLQKFILHTDIVTINFKGGTAEGFHDFLYFSFVTLTTLGYGDITPVSSIAKSITVVIAMTGQLYLTILVAMLVGKYLGRTER